MAIKTEIRADQVKAGQHIFINFRAAFVISAVRQGEGGMIKITWQDVHQDAMPIGYERSNLFSDNATVPALADGVKWPSPVSEHDQPLEWQKRGLQYTASGYGTKIPTTEVIKWSDGKVRRVYCDIYSNAGSCYCMIHGCKVSVEGFNLISEATK